MSGESSTLAARFDAHLTSLLGHPVKSARWKQFASGFSWITHGLSIEPPGFAGVTELVLRLGPPNGLLAPYRAAPQFEALKAVEGTAVPAPRVFAWSDDAAILGAPFFLAEKSPGVTEIPWNESSASHGHNPRRAIGEQFADILGELHALDWTQTGLARLSGMGRRSHLRERRQPHGRRVGAELSPLGAPSASDDAPGARLAP